jgi:hypothetical protein
MLRMWVLTDPTHDIARRIIVLYLYLRFVLRPEIDAGEAGAEPGAATAPGRPQRVRRPNTRLNPAEWVLK